MLKIQVHPEYIVTHSLISKPEHSRNVCSRSELERGNDKGVRFRFPTGEGGIVVCQAHNDHLVGVSGNAWRTDVKMLIYLSLYRTDDSAQVNIGAGGRGLLHSGSDDRVFIQADSGYIGHDAEGMCLFPVSTVSNGPD